MEAGELLSFKKGIIDAHCDTVHFFTQEKVPYVFSAINSPAQVDLPRMETGNIKVQFFAMYIEPEYKPCHALKRCLHLLDHFYRTMEKCSERIEIVFSYKDLMRVNTEGKIAAVATVEGGEVLEDDIGVLRILYRLGIRGLGLTWNQRNQLADGVWERDAAGGLTHLGREVIMEMNRLGMIIDLAHIAERGFDDVLALTTKPVIVSHANTRKICDHPRNLTDRQLKLLQENGGVVGLTFYPAFISPEKPGLEKLLDHFEHAAEVSGIDHLGIGSDFDGMGGNFLSDLPDVSSLPSLVEGLLSRGFTEEEVNKIMWGNFLRVINSNWKS